MVKLYQIKFIKDFKDYKIGDVIICNIKNSKSCINAGYGEMVGLYNEITKEVTPLQEQKENISIEHTREEIKKIQEIQGEIKASNKLKTKEGLFDLLIEEKSIEKRVKIIDDILLKCMNSPPMKRDIIFQKLNDITNISVSSIRETFKLLQNEEKIKAKKQIGSVLRINGIDIEKEIENKKELKISIEKLLITKQRDLAIELASAYILKNEIIYTTRIDELEEMWIYKKGIFIPNGKTYIREHALYFFDILYNKFLSNEVISKIIVKTYIEETEFFKVKETNKICIKNGVLDIFTKELSEFDPKYNFFSKLPITYVKDADCPNIKNFCQEVLSEEDIPVMQEWFGYVLLKDYRIPKGLLNVGNGRNGKSVMLSLFRHLLGIDNITSIPLQDLTKDPFAVGLLLNKHANLGADLSNEDLKFTGIFKELTGGDMTTANRKFKNRIKFINFAKLIFNANTIPYSWDMSDAFFSRWIIIEYLEKFYSYEEIGKMSEEERKDIKIANRDLIKKLTEPEEMSGLLNWALDGLKRLLEKGSFSYEKAISEIKQLYIRRSNSLIAFIDDNINLESNSSITKHDFMEAYKNYCKQFKINPLDERAIGRIMKKQGIRDKRDYETGFIRSWESVSLIEKKEEKIENHMPLNS